MKNLVRIAIDIVFWLVGRKKSFYGLLHYIYVKSLNAIEYGKFYHTPAVSGEVYPLKLLPDGEVVIFDCGSNIGQYASLCLKEVRGLNLHCFEPAKKTFHVLQDTFGESHILLNKIAVSDYDGQLTLFYDKELSGLASAVKPDFHHYSEAFEIEEVVECQRIDSYCIKNQIDRIHLLKLDVEGYDYVALMGASGLLGQDKVDMIQFEIAEANIDSKYFFKDFFNLLNGKFVLFRILSYGLYEIKQYSRELEVFFGANYLAVSINSSCLARARLH